MGRHVALSAEPPAASEPGELGFAPPVAFTPPASIPPAFASQPLRVPPPPAPWTLREAPALPPSRDAFTAINLVVPTQQALGPRALVWGIVSLVLNVMLLPSIFAIVWGAMGVARIRRLRSAGVPASGGGTSVAGIVLGGLGVVMSAVWALLVLHLR